MDGPYTIEQAHVIYGGHFCTCPLGLVEKLGSSALRMIHHFSKEDQFGDSTNSWVDSVDFLTRWFTAMQTADFMSLDLTYFPKFPFSMCLFFTQHISHHALYSFLHWAVEAVGINFPCASPLPQEDYDHLDACA